MGNEIAEIKIRLEKIEKWAWGEKPKSIQDVDFERATEIATNFIHKHGYPFAQLDTTSHQKDGWDFYFDVGPVSKEIMVVGVNKDGGIKRFGLPSDPKRLVNMTTHEIAEKVHKLVWETPERVREDPHILLPYIYELERRTADC